MPCHPAERQKTYIISNNSETEAKGAAAELRDSTNKTIEQ